MTWDGTMSPYWRKAAVQKDFVAESNHTSNIQVEVTQVVAGFATVVVHFNHECDYNGKHYHPASNDIGYEYDLEVDENADEVEVLKDLEALSPKELMQLLDTATPTV